MAYNPNNPNGQAAMAASAPVVIASNQTGVPVTFTGSTDVATQTTLSAINAKLVTGTDIGDVTINNSTGASAVNIQDGGNSLTVDYATTGSGTATGALRVELPTNGTGVVGINAGSALIGKVSIDQATANANEVVVKSITAGSNVIGKVTIDQTTPGTTNKVSVGADVVHTIVDSGSTVVTQGTATNLKTQAEIYQGGTAVSTSAPLQVSLANTAANATAVKVNVASGGIASGAIASGALAAGSIASGAAVSGAFADGADVTLGAKADAKSTATDGTAITLMQVAKQISASVQAPGGTGSTGGGVPATACYDGSISKSADSAATTTGYLTGNMSDLLGKQIVMPYALPQQLVQGNTAAMTATTSTQVIAGVASNYIYITQLTVSNSHASVGTVIFLQDGSAGTTIYTVPANYGFGGATITFTTPLKVPTAGNGLFCVNGTTGANTYVSAVGFKSTI